MSATSMTVHLHTDEAVQALQLLAQAAQRSLELRNRLLGLVDLFEEFRFVEVEGLPAAAADGPVLRLELGQRLADLVAAVRAGQFDAV